MELQAAGRVAAALQELDREQLQKPADHTEHTQENTVVGFKMTGHERGHKGLKTEFHVLPALPVFPLQHLKGLSEHEANQLFKRRKQIIPKADHA